MIVQSWARVMFCESVYVPSGRWIVPPLQQPAAHRSVPADVPSAVVVTSYGGDAHGADVDVGIGAGVGVVASADE